MTAGGLVIGTVGWQDGLEPQELGDSTNDGVSLVKVTLFASPDVTKTPEGDRAQGQPILCRLSGTVVDIPRDGDQVLVAVPQTFGMVPGAATILCRIGNEWKGLKNAGPGDIVIPIPGSQGALYLRTRDGSLTFATTDDNTEAGNAVFFKIGGTSGGTNFAMRLVSPWGMVDVGPNGCFIKHASGAQLRMGQINGLPTPLDALASYAKLKGAFVKIDGTAVLLGPDIPAQTFFPCLYVQDITGPAFVPSPFASVATAMTAFSGALDEFAIAIAAATPAVAAPADALALAGEALADAFAAMAASVLASTTVRTSP